MQLALTIFLVLETYHSVLLHRKAEQLRKEIGYEAWKAPIENDTKFVQQTVSLSCIRPFQLLIFEPMVRTSRRNISITYSLSKQHCLNLCILCAILLGILYLFFGAFPLVFENNHGFTLSQVGLAFLGLLVGMVLGILSDIFWRKNFTRLVRKREALGGEPSGSEPEFRLPPTVLGAVIVPFALFGKFQKCLSGLLLISLLKGFGWTTYSKASDYGSTCEAW